jgi:hypothetical protein
MGLFDIFKKQAPSPAPVSNAPEMLSCKLLFKAQPVIDNLLILAELQKTYPTVENMGELLFAFPEVPVVLSDATIPAQCSIMVLADALNVPQDALQQNWHWPEATAAVGECRYEVLVTDLMTRTLDYKTRHRLFMAFLAAVIRVTQPAVVYSLPAQKLIAPDLLLTSWGAQQSALDILINVRLYNVSDSPEQEMLMDTVGLHTFGLPDLQIRFSNEDPSAIGTLLWNYAYYIFDKGNVIQDGNTIMGPTEGSKLTCHHTTSLLPPVRQVINIS